MIVFIHMVTRAWKLCMRIVLEDRIPGIFFFGYRQENIISMYGASTKQQDLNLSIQF